MTNATALPGRALSASDDAQRMLLSAVLHDAAEWHYAAAKAPCCRAAGGTCAAHWDAHEVPAAAYRALADQLAEDEGLPRGAAAVLTAGQRRVLAAALDAALAYRTGRAGPGNAALIAAYRELARTHT